MTRRAPIHTKGFSSSIAHLSTLHAPRSSYVSSFPPSGSEGPDGGLPEDTMEDDGEDSYVDDALSSEGDENMRGGNKEQDFGRLHSGDNDQGDKFLERRRTVDGRVARRPLIRLPRKKI